MNILCASDITYQQLLTNGNISDIIHLNPFVTLPNINIINKLNNKFQFFDCIIVISPTIVEICKTIFISNCDKIFLTMGKVSAKLLMEIGISAKNIIYSNKSDGVSGLINDILPSLLQAGQNFKYCILQGITENYNDGIYKLQNSNSSNLLFNFLDKYQVNYQIFNIYLRSNNTIIQDQYINLLYNNQINRIIITSSLFLECLINIINQNNYNQQLKLIYFLTWQKKVFHKFTDYGIIKNRVLLNNPY